MTVQFLQTSDNIRCDFSFDDNCSHGNILPTVACLMGPTTIKVECKLRREHVNLFMVCVSAPGSGKSPAFHNVYSQPIRTRVEEQSDTALFADVFTQKGLFNQLKKTRGHKAIVGKEEVSQFFEQILGVNERSRLDVERLIQLYDGATWVYTKGDKEIRMLNRVAIMSSLPEASEVAENKTSKGDRGISMTMEFTYEKQDATNS
ncbi:hypothetical protein ACROYT_G014646 [Oculina patagonica]